MPTPAATVLSELGDSPGTPKSFAGGGVRALVEKSQVDATRELLARAQVVCTANTEDLKKKKAKKKLRKDDGKAMSKGKATRTTSQEKNKVSTEGKTGARTKRKGRDSAKVTMDEESDDSSSELPIKKLNRRMIQDDDDNNYDDNGKDGEEKDSSSEDEDEKIWVADFHLSRIAKSRHERATVQSVQTATAGVWHIKEMPSWVPNPAPKLLCTAIAAAVGTPDVQPCANGVQLNFGKRKLRKPLGSNPLCIGYELDEAD